MENIIKKIKNYLLKNPQGESNKYLKESLTTGINKILFALKYNNPIIVYGDYDTDGILSSSIMYVYLKKLKEISNSNSIIDIKFSDRNSFFGMGEKLYNELSKKYGLIIMTDNGSTESFLNNSIDNLLVLDHHPTENKYPYIINPNIDTSKYSTSGGKVVFDFLELLDINLDKKFNLSLFKNNKDFYNLLKELAAITLISDMAFLNEHNRKFIQEAFETLKEKKLPTFSRLNEFNNVEISFKIVSQINAVSRMEKDLNIVLKWLFPKNIYEFNFANKIIEEINNLKKRIILDIFSQITKEQFNENIIFIDDKILYLENKEIKPGIAGLLANKLLTEFNKPAIVCIKTENGYVGSARGRNILSYFNKLKEENETFFKNGSYGGHPDAMGFHTNSIKDIEIIRNNLNKYDYEYSYEILTDKVFNIEEYALIKKFYQEIANGVDFSKKINLLIKNEADNLNKRQLKDYTIFSNDNNSVKFLIPNQKIKNFTNSKYFLIELSVSDIENVKFFLDDKNDIKYKIIESEKEEKNLNIKGKINNQKITKKPN